MSSGEGWTKNKRGRDVRTPVSARTHVRSLKDALSEAGLGEADRIERGDSASLLADALSAPPTPLVTPRIALFEDQQETETPRRVAPEPVTARPASSVVSPAPWQRAATRGRRRALLLNTFGWVMTLVVAGSIIGVAGRYLVVSPVGLQPYQAARQ